MIEDLKPFELQTYYQRVLQNGIDGLKGIEIFQANQLKTYAENIRFNNIDTLNNLLLVNPNYDYPENFRNKKAEYWKESIGGFSEPQTVLDIIERFLGNNEAKESNEKRFWLTTFDKGEAQMTGAYNSLKSQIETSGWFIVNYNKNPVKIYTPELALIFCSENFPAKNLDTQEETKIKVSDYLKSYIEGYNEGAKYFDDEYGISANTLYGANANKYVRDIHLNFFHIEHEGLEQGWQYIKKSYPIIWTPSILRKHGYYSGIVSKVESMVKKYPKLFQTFDKCEHDLPSPQIKTETTHSRTKEVISNELQSIDKNKGWEYAFTNETDYNTFLDILTCYFEYKPYSLPKQNIKLKKDCKTRFAKALNPIHKELSNENKKLKTDTDFFNLIRVLSHFEKLTDAEIYQAITR